MRGGSLGNMAKKRKEVRRVMSWIRRIVLRDVPDFYRWALS